MNYTTTSASPRDDALPVERAVLGALLLGNSRWSEAKLLCDTDFYLAAHQHIFRRMRELAESGRPIDPITLVAALTSDNEVQRIGGVEYLSSLIDNVVERPNIAHYVKIVKERALRRAGEKVADRLQRMARDGSASAGAMAKEASRFATDVAEAAQHDDWPEPAPLGGELPPVSSFELQLLPSAFRPLVEDTAERMQVPIDYPAIVAVNCQLE